MTEEKNSPFLTSTTERNFRVVVEERDLFVYKDQLIALSPVFDQMIKSDFLEKKQGFITLNEKTFDDILELFGILFPVGKVRKMITLENVEKMVTFADEYDIEQLRVDIGLYLRANLHNLKFGDQLCVKLANYAWQIGNCLDIVKICIPFICQTTFSNTDLPKDILFAVYEAKSNRLSGSQHRWEDTNNRCNKCQKSFAIVCNKCRECRSCFLSQSVCTSVHKMDCQYRYRKEAWGDIKCFCGYDFDETFLS